jgi:cell pole-organizing protein PopZ
MSQPGEPSVEEILESIKKVIARDNRAGAAEQRKTRESRGVAAVEPDPEYYEDEEEVLELGESAEFVDSDDVSATEAPLVNPEARESMRESLAALAMLSEPGAQPQIVRSGETSLEGLVRDLLRPALADWLDKNLPPLVEKLVATEIARIVGKKG